MFNNKSILITGGTGTFGKAFCNELATNHKPKKIIIFSRDELKQFEMAKTYNQKFFRFFIGDVRDSERLNMAMKNVDFVVHAAAMKQVEISEYNPQECIKTNINGAQNIIQAAINNKVKKVIALSSDKAVGPLNLYGATKLASEKLFIAANNIAAGSTIFSSVRYGNVSGSRGSVIPYFKSLVDNNSIFIPITDMEMTRFFILIEDGVKFVLKSLERMQGGEIFIPKLNSFKIINLIKAIAPTKKIKIIGIRPGEKIHEILYSKDESRYCIEFNDHYLMPPLINLTYKKNFFFNSLKEKGKKINKIDEYSSYNGSFLSILQIKNYLKKNNII
jgi:UDP-N-acetylglucosamine 4,6-dehydratase